MPAFSAMQARVGGLVQGVGFRYSTKRKADSLGLAGWVKNNPDGTVEVLIQGKSQSIAEMDLWLHQGPAGARVFSYDSRVIDVDSTLLEFEIKI